MADLPCPCCHASGRVTRLDVSIGVTWILWAAFGLSLPEGLNGALLLTWVGLLLWRWSGRPPKETPAHREPCWHPTVRGPFYGTHVMPPVELPEGYEPPSAAVGGPAVDLQYRQLVTSWRKAAEELAAALYGAVGVHPDLMQAAPIANAVEMWERLNSGGAA